MTVKVGGGTRSLTGTNGGLIGEGKMPVGDVDLDVGGRLDAFELMLSVGNLTAWNFGLLYRLLLNNGLGMTPLLIDDLDDGLDLFSSVSRSHLS